MRAFRGRSVYDALFKVRTRLRMLSDFAAKAEEAGDDWLCRPLWGGLRGPRRRLQTVRRREPDMIYLLVGLGGALGAMARHGVNHVVHQRLLSAWFPWGIFTINVAGPFLIGLLGGLLVSERLTWGYPARTFVIVGVLGGFTTFSSFSFDTLVLAREGRSWPALANVVGQVGLSLLAVWIGFGWGLSTKGSIFD